ncbi:hypothetical protein [Sphingobium subterraneum]|uniref:Uncharacterized protein n=1 Tax=Sphingobium subterraneum TaxID=627688 RepID=A0A841IWL3_9SPHN|nr:hypothetical protein [Sphingobium subterraneum]MBB6122660.1 hypothetical protein [Sphingobium subterraneum]
MKRALPILAALFVANPALAAKKEDAWAQCLWKNVPTSSANWLALKPPVEKSRLDAPETPDVTLQYRLRASCERELTPLGKKWAPTFSAEKVRAALSATRPASIGPDQMQPKAFRCDYYFEDDLQLKTRARFEWGFEDEAGRQIWSSVDYGFAGTKGGAVFLTKGAGIKKMLRRAVKWGAS